MKVYKASYKGRDGETHTSEKYYIDFYDHKNRRHKLAGFSDYKATKELSRNIELLISYSGQHLPKELQSWIEKLPQRFLSNLVKWRLIDSRRAEGVKPLDKHLEDWKKSLEITGTKKNSELKYSRVKRVFDSCKFNSLGDISASTVELHVSRLCKIVKQKKAGEICLVETDEPISQRTQHHIMTTCKQFCKWAKADGRTGNNPLEYLKPIQVTQKQTRAAFSLDEIKYLLSFTQAASKRFNMTGYERALLYRLAVQTGLRAGEIRHLTAGCFDFEEQTVTLPGQYTKNNHEAVLPLRNDTAELFREYLACKLPKAKVFNLTEKGSISKMIHRDMAEARERWIKDTKQKDSSFLAVQIEKGKRDFHSLRHTFATMLAATGTHPKTAQTLLRHSKVDLTMSIYTHSLRDKETSAISDLPDLDKISESQSQKKTGTDNRMVDAIGEICTDRCFTKNTAKHADYCVDLQNLGDKKGSFNELDNEPKTAFLGQNQGKNGEGEIRTRGTGLYPFDGLANRLPKSVNSDIEKTYKTAKNCTDRSLDKILIEHPELKQILSSWQGLPSSIRSVILTLVGEHKQKLESE